MNEQNEKDMAAFAAEVDRQLNQDSIEVNEAGPTTKTGIGNPENLKKMKEDANDKVAEQTSKTLDELHAEKADKVRQEAIDKGLAPAIVPISQLPTKGLFYPAGTEIRITSATIGDIKRWTSMNEEDTSDTREKVANILESCCRITFGAGSNKYASWRDIIDVDRLYLLFAIHDYTFPDGTNDIKIRVSENETTILKKECVKYLNLSEKLMKYYNPDKHCFSFPVKKTAAFRETNGKMDIYLTSIGVAEWLMDYAETCRLRNQGFDKNFLAYAALLIPDWRGLTEDSYYKLIAKTQDWSDYEWSLISKIKDVIADSAQIPTLTFKDRGGMEQEVPLNFRDGIKCLFQRELDIDL